MSEQRVPEWTVADRLAKARAAAGLEQQDLADYLGLSRGAISKYERGFPVKLQTLRLWAIRCGVPLEWLTGSFTPPDQENPISGWTSVMGCLDDYLEAA